MTRHSLIPEAHLLLFKLGGVLLLRRQDTGYEDGNYSVIAGHVEVDETATEAMVREASEEAGLKIERRNLRLCHIVHRKAKDERISFFFTASDWVGEPKNLEPHKCSELSWFNLSSLPENMVPYVRQAIENVQRGEIYSEFGWAQQGAQADRPAFGGPVRLSVRRHAEHHVMKVPGLRSSYEKVDGIVYFGRMLDKIRLHASGRLPDGYNLGTKVWTWFDARCTRFLAVDYEALVQRVLRGGTDEEILAWCFEHGRRPGEEDIEIWNEFMTKRGWRDSSSGVVAEAKRLRGFAHRDDIQMAFEFHVADESSDDTPAA